MTNLRALIASTRYVEGAESNDLEDRILTLKKHFKNQFQLLESMKHRIIYFGTETPWISAIGTIADGTVCSRCSR